ncbi:MAG: carbamoyl phosphate synthase large subunit, partial [Rhodospirillales bacterium]|nr:carbamoyl phosphate synthase large subunit [Rhodospirillales bacterium]
PFVKFPGVDPLLGPEMKSTGEVMGIDKDFPSAFAKSQLGAGTILPSEGAVFISIKDADKAAARKIATRLEDLGFEILATRGTAQYFSETGITVREVNKVLDGRPHCVDAIMNGEVQLVINTTEGAQAISDSFSIRRSALTGNIPHYTTINAAAAAAAAIAVQFGKNSAGGLAVAPLQSYSNRSSE